MKESNDLNSNFAFFSITFSFVVATLFLFGFSYFNEFLKSFSLSELEININYHSAVANGVDVLMRRSVDGQILSLILLFSMMGLVYYIYRSSRTKQFWIRSAFGLILISLLSVYTGAEYAVKDVRDIMKGNLGKVAYCQLKATVSEKTRTMIEKMTRDHKMRKILETRDMLYLTFVSSNNEENEEVNIGQSIAIQKTDIDYCRFSVVLPNNDIL